MRRTVRLFALPVLLFLLWCGTVLAREARPFFFIQLTDPQLGMYAADADVAQEAANLEFAVATANRLKPAFVVVTGDLVNRPGDARQIAEYRRIMSRLNPGIALHNVAGNHDVGNVPTPESLRLYRSAFGPDYYTFRVAGAVFFVLDSTLIHAPQGAPAEYEKQERWLRDELRKARAAGARHMIVLQHHPWYLENVDEPDTYDNIPLERRRRYLDLFREYGVTRVFSGHYHQNRLVQAGDMEFVVTGPIGKPLGKDPSGLRIVTVRETGIAHAYFDLGSLPHAFDASR